MGKSFLKRVSPSRSRTKVIDWPFPVEGETPKIRMSVLGSDKMEAANLDAVDHFAGLKRKVSQSDDAFVARERTGLVFYAYEAKSGDEWEPLAASIDELAEESTEVVATLYQEWAKFQAEVTTRPMTPKQMTALIEELKKNSHAVPLEGLPSSWLIELVRTLASPPVPLTLASGVG